MFIAFSILIGGFIAYKWPYLDLPYYWDELGVYANGAIEMAKHRISLAPNALEPGISRGHPLLSYVCFAIPYRIWGLTPTVGHITSLFISIAVLLSVFQFCYRFFNPWVGVIAVGITVAQPLFLAQSGLVLPEMLLALFCIWALYAYANNSWWQFALFASLAILVKETAIILPVVAISVEIIYGLFHRGQNKWVSGKWLAWLVPFCVFGAFLLIQKQQNGWYFFDVHTDSIDTSLSTIWKKAYDYGYFLLWGQGRYWMLPLLGLYALVSTYRLGIAHALKTMVEHVLNMPKAQLAIYMFILGMVSFSSINFFMERYMLSALVALSIPLAVLLNSLTGHKQWAKIIVLVLIVGNACFFAKADHFTYDVDMSYVDEVKALQEGIYWMEGHVPEDALIWPDFPPMFALEKSTMGYVANKSFTNTSYDKERIVATAGSYVLRMTPGANITGEMPDDQFDLVHVSEVGYARCEIFRNKLTE